MENKSTQKPEELKPTANQILFFYLFVIVLGIVCFVCLIGAGAAIKEAPKFAVDKYAPMAVVLVMILCVIVMFLLGVFDPEEPQAKEIQKIN